MKKIILLIIIVFVIGNGYFSIPVSSASIFGMNRESDVGDAVREYYDALRVKNLKYVIDHIAKFQDMLSQIHKENPKKNWGDLDKGFFLYWEGEAKKDPKTFWEDWPRVLDGTRVSIDEVRRLDNTEASEMGIKNRDEVYQVFVHFSFTKRSSSVFDQKNAVLLKEFVLQVFVYYDHGKMLVDGERVSDVPIGHRPWSNDE